MNGLTNGKEKMGDKIHKSFLAAIVILAVGAVDYSTVYQLSFSIFYLIPILLLTRTWGIGGGTAGSVASAGMWLWISLISPKYSYGAILTPYFNACVRLCFFLIITWIIDKWEKEKTRSRIDPLTGLANRTAFYEMTELEKKRGQRYQRPLSIAYLDVDNFKTINDRFGHRRGDESLRFIAQLIRRNIRASDFVSRLGGDEFIILMPETSEPAAHIALVRLQRLLALKEN